MYVGRDFSPQENGESEVFGLDFVNDIDVGETLMTTTWTIKVVDGVDPAPELHLEGPPKVVIPVGGVIPTCSIQRIGGLFPYVTYKVTANSVTSLGNLRNLWSHVRGVYE